MTATQKTEREREIEIERERKRHGVREREVKNGQRQQ